MIIIYTRDDVEGTIWIEGTTNNRPNLYFRSTFGNNVAVGIFNNTHLVEKWGVERILIFWITTEKGWCGILVGKCQGNNMVLSRNEVSSSDQSGQNSRTSQHQTTIYC